MAIPHNKYLQCFINDGLQEYLALPLTEEVNFDKWVSLNFNKLVTIYTYDQVAPSSELFDEMVAKGYVHDHECQCHYLAKAITLLDKRFNFCTGFLVDSYNNFYGHSFNMFNNHVIDFSRYNFKNPHNFDNFPYVYFGTHIDNEFVEKYRDQTLENFSMNPLLIDWYNDQKE